MGGEKHSVLCKIVMIGNSGAGKTSLVNRWINGKFDERNPTTIGVNHFRKAVKFGTESTDVCVWDTAGQEQYQSLAPLYARAAAVAIAVAAVDDKESFNKLSMWLDMVFEPCDDIPPVILAVSKTDLPCEEWVFDIKTIEEQYGPMFKGVFYTSSCTGENVNELFLQASQLGLQFLHSNVASPINVEDRKRATKEKGCC